MGNARKELAPALLQNFMEYHCNASWFCCYSQNPQKARYFYVQTRGSLRLTAGDVKMDVLKNLATYDSASVMLASDCSFRQNCSLPRPYTFLFAVNEAETALAVTSIGREIPPETADFGIREIGRISPAD